MTKYLVEEQTLTDIADAIREQTGDENPIMLSNFASEIGSIQGGGSVNYSTTEHEVGTWIDGSTIYEKTIYYAGGVQASSITVAHGISNFGRVISIEASMSDNNTQGQYFVVPRITSGGESLSVNKIDGTNIYFITPTQLEDRLVDWYITIRYIKAST